MANDTYKGEFYCVKCKSKVEGSGTITTNDKGRRMAKGACPTCGTSLTRFLPKA